MKIIYLSLFIFYFTISVVAQKETNIWYFGRNAGLDFNSGAPVALLDGKLNTTEGCASISDKNGSLLFYTDGSTVYNKNHSIMKNGRGLTGHKSTTHSALIIPKPKSINNYYIFTIDADENTPNKGLRFSEVNMTLNEGLGAVISKNFLLFKYVNEKITAIALPNSDSYWIISHDRNRKFIVYELTACGVNKTPIISEVGPPSLSPRGQIKISPDGSKLALVRASNLSVAIAEVLFFDFNFITGAVTNPNTLLLSNTESFYGIEFSPDSNLLYISDNKGVSQFNLNAGVLSDIINSRVPLIRPNTKAIRSLQLGPDNKIYVCVASHSYLDIISNPNTVGIGCNYKQDGIFLGGRKSSHGLPTFIPSLFFLKKILFENVCFGDSTKFSLPNTVDSVVWNFGDPASGINNTSTDFEPSHVFSSPGVYNVSISAIVGSNTIKETTTVLINKLPVITPIVELKQCDDDLDGFTAFNLNKVISKITTNNNSCKETVSFFESQADAENNNNPIINITAYINKTINNDTIWARVENNDYECYSIGLVNLIVTTSQITNSFERNFFICDDDDGISSLDFNNITSEIEAMFPSNQQLKIKFYRNKTDALAEENPINTSFLNYRNIDSPNTQIYIRVDSEPDNDCIGLGSHINLFIRDEESGNCDGSVSVIDFPHFFTPNNDGINDVWRIKSLEQNSDIKISIFNRYGKLLKIITDTETGWDGSYSGSPLASDEYWFLIEVLGKSIRGHFTLKR